MKHLSIFLILLITFSCSQPNESEFEWQDITVTGEFLFEGPNTLQGPAGPILDQISGESDISTEEIKGVYISTCDIRFEPDSMRSQVENALVQMVSDKLELVSLATINGIPETGTIQLNTSGEQDILPYLKDPSATLVLDANTTSDMDQLDCKVNFKLIIKY